MCVHARTCVCVHVLCVFASIYVCRSVCLSVCLCVCRSVCMSVFYHNIFFCSGKLIAGVNAIMGPSGSGKTRYNLIITSVQNNFLTSIDILKVT